jgi:hypothetical protein
VFEVRTEIANVCQQMADKPGSRRSMTADGLHCCSLRGRRAKVIRTIKLHPEPLPPGVYPIIGPEIATYGVVDRPAIRDDDARHLA